MFEHVSSSERTIAIQRLTALWALNECGLGGILHAVQSPFTGLLVGGIAMACIAFICAFAENKWKAVMSALIVVLIIKALVSPHSTPTAYLAVIFQGVTGALIYRFVPGLLFSSVLFMMIGFIESAVQHLLVLTVLYGNTLWEAIDIWGKWVTEKWGFIISISSSQLIIYSYLAIHVITGLLMGWVMYKMIMTAHREWGLQLYQLELSRDDRKSIFKSESKKKNWKRVILFVILIAIIISAYSIQSNAGGLQKGLLAILRAIAILIIWFVFLAPFLIKILQRYLHQKHRGLSEQVAHTMDIIPHIAWILDKAWRDSKHLGLLARWKSFIIHSLLYTLQYKSSYDTDPDRAYPKP